MYAIIRDRGRQHVAREGEVLVVDLRDDVKDGDSVEFAEVLLTSDGAGAVKVGEPVVDGAKVSGTVVEALHKGEKIDVVHFRRRKDSMTKIGHRQKYTRVKVEKIEAGS